MFLSVSTINSMDDIVGSVILTERVKTRKSLATNYWQDTISGFEVKSNDRNVKNLWKVSTGFQFCAIFHFKTTFLNLWKIHVSKNLGGLQPPQPHPISTGLRHYIEFSFNDETFEDFNLFQFFTNLLRNHNETKGAKSIYY